jgi:FtsZ-interacting cell division protein ZipA
MKDKAKRTWLIVLGALVCVALVVAIAGRFSAPSAVIDPALDSGTPATSEPVVDIDTPEDSDKSEVVVQIDAGGKGNDTDPAAGADSDGTEQSIQAEPTKPKAPENPTPIEENHDGEDVPESERNTETPPTYKSEQTTVTPPSEPQGGEGYLPGFGYIESSGEGTVTHDDTIYENGNKVGVMD